MLKPSVEAASASGDRWPRNMTSVVVMKLIATLVSTIGQARAKVAAISPRREVMAEGGE